MRALVLYAHPCEESFAASLHRAIVETLTAKGWQVDDCDLYAEGFNPVLSAAERRGYHDTETNTAPVQAYVGRLMAADAMILCFPVWNYGYPAILKGFFDRVFLPGLTFRMENGRVKPGILQLKTLITVTTYGGSRLRTFLAGDPPRNLVSRALWASTGRGRQRYLALHDMNRVTEGQRTAFLTKVRAEIGQL